MRWILVILFCFLAPAAQAQTNYVFRGETYQFQPLKVEGKTAIALDDPALQKLLQYTSARLQVSTSGKTLYVFLPGRESYWSDSSDVYTRDGKEVDAPGQFFAKPAAMEPSALWSALGLKAFQTAGGVQLYSVVTDIGSVAPDSLEFRFLTSAPVKHKVKETEPGTIEVELQETAWDGGQRTLSVGDADIEVLGGDSVDRPVVVRCKFLPFWSARVKVGFTRELLVSPEPRHFDAPAQEAVLTSVSQPTSSAMTVRGPVPQPKQTEVRFDFDRPVQFFWAYYPKENQLKVEFPATNGPAGTKVLSTSSYHVTRYEVMLREGDNFEFFQREDAPNTLFLRLGSKDQVQGSDPIGTAAMAGYFGGAGSVVLDPGHGGGDPGCHNRNLGVYEKDVTLDICLRMQQILQSQGWKVFMTRTTDRDVTYAGSPDLMELQARADVANNNQADLFVSIHCNASISPAVRGSSVYWWKPEDRALAEYLDVLGEGLGFEHDGLIQNNFAVLRLSGMPSVLVETAFLTNATEGRLLATPEVRQQIAERLAAGLGRYMAERRRTQRMSPGTRRG